MNHFITVRSVRSWNSFPRVVNNSSHLRDLNSGLTEQYKNTVVRKCTIDIQTLQLRETHNSLK